MTILGFVNPPGSFPTLLNAQRFCVTRRDLASPEWNETGRNAQYQRRQDNSQRLNEPRFGCCEQSRTGDDPYPDTQRKF